MIKLTHLKNNNFTKEEWKNWKILHSKMHLTLKNSELKTGSFTKIKSMKIKQKTLFNGLIKESGLLKIRRNTLYRNQYWNLLIGCRVMIRSNLSSKEDRMKYTRERGERRERRWWVTMSIGYWERIWRDKETVKWGSGIGNYRVMRRGWGWM